MFFKALTGEVRAAMTRGATPTPSQSVEEATIPLASPVDPSGVVGLGLVLDAMGEMLAALARYPLDRAQLPAAESAAELMRWRQHATLGTPLTSDAESAALNVVDRDWHGLVRAVTDVRQDEHQHTTSTVAELRDALWSCVETVHQAVRIDQRSDLETQSQMEKARDAMKRLQTGSIKQEVSAAISAIEAAIQERRTQQADQFHTLASRLETLGQQLEEARRESTTDALTGVGNRKLFDTMIVRAAQMFSLSRQPVVLLLIDMDRLKMVNDMYGHIAGDAAIASLGTALKQVFLRTSDAICRYGGDEFAVLLHNTEWSQAKALALRLQEALSALPSPHPAMEFSVGISVGVAQLQPLEDAETWTSRADAALYKAKHNGYERVVVAEPRPRPQAA
jgi:diguanylate cyclase (GGDEF)-like protein